MFSIQLDSVPSKGVSSIWIGQGPNTIGDIRY